MKKLFSGLACVMFLASCSGDTETRVITPQQSGEPDLVGASPEQSPDDGTEHTHDDEVGLMYQMVKRIQHLQ